MPKPIEFDRDVFLEAAMLHFWEQGYNATSIRDLTARTGLHAGSIYHTFKNKRSLFLETLKLYFNQRMEEINSLFGVSEPALIKLKNYLDHIVKGSMSRNDCKGCFMVNTISENMSNDEEIQGYITNSFQKMEREIKKILDDAKSEGTIAKDKDTSGLANLIITTIHGLSILNKIHLKKETLEAIINNLMLSVKS